MDRRDLLRGSAAVAAVGAVATVALGAKMVTTPLPKRDRVRVAFLLGEGTNMIDVAGPWEVFQDARGTALLGRMRMPFELFTVAPDLGPRRMTGGFNTSAHHMFADAPQPHVIVVPALQAEPGSIEWLKGASRKSDLTMSVCTGAFQLARAGLLDGYPVTTHHEHWDRFAREFPHLDLQRGPRFIDSGRIATAGGLTSGIDLALHVVSRYLGADAAAATATYMEYSSEAWRSA